MQGTNGLDSKPVPEINTQDKLTITCLKLLQKVPL